VHPPRGPGASLLERLFELFRNRSPFSLRRGRFLEELESLAGASGLERSRIVLELNERDRMIDHSAFRDLLSRWRSADNLGRGYSGLSWMVELEPAYVISRGFRPCPTSRSTLRRP
jgi:EAL domain-containing protein (putative c-di-GMP-specific phosphodiesterase class I)